MSIETKFRAWDTETKEISYDYLSKNWLKVCIESPHIELMQYTGIKERKNKEVYQSDILRLNSPTGYWRLQAYGFEPKNAHNERFVVTKLDCGFVLRHVSFYEIIGTESWDAPNLICKGWTIINNYEFWNEQRNFELIGNIYENPELLIL